MNLNQFRDLHKNGSIKIKCKDFRNTLPSDTDPTQDIPIKQLNIAANGDPLNVRNLPLVFSNAGVESLSSIERRNNDKFDVVGELQAHESSMSKVFKQRKIHEFLKTEQNEN